VSWSAADIPSQQGRTALVTGVTLGGIGYHVALELARAGGRVVLAGRTPDKLAAAEKAILEEVPTASLQRLVVDLASFASVRDAAADVTEPVDVLVNNAGVMAPPYRRTEDGFESQLATNHLGPFLLTGLLLPRLRDGGRVVAVSSNGHRMARRAPLSDPTQKPSPYLRWVVYGQTKLANLLFTFELDRRLRAVDREVTALAAHPGYAGTHLVANGRFGRSGGGLASLYDAVMRATGQPPATAALPPLMAATADLPGSTYVGPSGLGEWYGAPQVVGCSALARHPGAARRLWELSEDVTGIRYP
jgi:NAD(P)-dependent dehydrogenase (short-subunit alcohol dehydrogenase family)